MNTVHATGIFVRILPPFIIGILVFYGDASIISTMITCLLLFAVLLSVNFMYKRIRAYRYKGITGMVFYAFAFYAGGLAAMRYDELLEADHFTKLPYKFLKISIKEEPRIKNKVIRFKAKVHYGYDSKGDNSLKVAGSLSVRILIDSSSDLNLSYGDELIIPNTASIIKPPVDGSGFDFKSWLASHNIHHQVFLRERQVVRLNTNSGNCIVAYALALRQRQVAFYRKIIKSDEAFAVAATLLLGYRSDLDTQTLGIYSRTGTIHALSVSGMHVGLVYLVLNWGLQLMDRRKWLAMVKVSVILMAIWFYALVTGFSPSVLRSVVMLSIFIIAKSLARQANNYNIVAFTALCLLLYSPFLIWDIGFQLSFLAVIGLIWLQPMVQRWWHPGPALLSKLWSTVAMSFSAQLITFPLSLYYFHQFPVYFLIGNLFILLPIALLMYLGIAILIFDIAALGPIFEWMIGFTNNGLAIIADLPYSTISDISINRFELIMLYTMIGLFVAACSQYKKQLLFASMFCFLALQSSVAYRKMQCLSVDYLKQQSVNLK